MQPPPSEPIQLKSSDLPLELLITSVKADLQVSSNGCFAIDQQTTWRPKPSWQRAIKTDGFYNSPCPTAECSLLKTKLILEKFTLLPIGERPRVDHILSRDGTLTLTMPSEALRPLLGQGDNKQVPIFVVSSYITGYSTKGIHYPVRASMPGIEPITNGICNWDTSSSKGAQLLPDTEQRFLNTNNACWLSHCDVKENGKMKWINRLSRCDFRQVRRQIEDLSSELGLVQVPIRFNQDTGIAEDFLSWMTCHYYHYLREYAVKHNAELPPIDENSKTAPAYRDALRSCLDFLEGLSGTRNVLNIAKGFEVQLQIGQGGLIQLQKDREEEFKGGVVDELDRQQERVSAWVELVLEFYAYQAPQLSYGFSAQYLQGSTVPK